MQHVRTLTRSCTAAAILLLPFAAPAAAQDSVVDREGYETPSAEIAEAAIAPWHRNVELERPSPGGGTFVVEERERRLPPLSLLGRRHYNLGGFQVDPRADRARALTTRSPDGFRLLSARDGDDIAVQTPRGAKVGTARWSPAGDRLAFFAHFDDATHIYVADAATGEARRLTPRPVLATLTTSFDWTADGRHIFTVLVPEARGPEPAEPAVATTPRIDVTTDEENTLRTYPDLLETPHDRALVEYYATGQLARIDVESGATREIGEPAMIAEVDAAPDGRHVRVGTMQKPFSSIVPVYRFARLEEIWDLEGVALAEVDRQPVRDGADDDDDDERREIAWRPDGQGLGFLEREPAPDEEESADDEAADSSRTDRVMQWLPPFDSSSLRVVHESESELDDLRYSDDAGLLFLSVEDDDADRERLVAVDPGADATYTLASRDPDDVYDDPGSLVTRTGASGERVVRVSSDGEYVYLSGTVYHEEPLANPPQPFLDRVAIRTGDTARLFESASDSYGDVVGLIGDDAGSIVLSRESATDVPDYFVRELDGGGERRLTDNQDYLPDITGAQRHAFMVERADGIEFMVRVVLPRDYEPGTRLPALFWFYPREYEDEDAYRESTRYHNPNDFPSPGVRSPELLLRSGYAIVRPDLPIIGPRRTWNERYVPDLRNTLSATIDAVAERGWIDRDRLAIGGHSYGGFGTINAMIQTPYFKAGIAGSANSNRTLTPAGFQREQRTLWEARETYKRMSPMFWMNELNGALLMYHGLQDQNVGTFPDHSVRSFHALNALGKTAALYMYPYEAHGPRAEETILDLWTRWTAWLDRHVKDAGEPAEAVAEDAATGLP